MDAVFKLVEKERILEGGELPSPILKLEKWASWMKDEGLLLSSEEIAEGTKELLYMSEEEEVDMIQQMIKIRRCERSNDY